MKNENTQIQADGTLNQIQVNCLASLLKYLRNEGDNMDKNGQYDKSVRYFDLADSLDIAVFALSQKEATPKQIALINRYVSSIK
jgi:hypothetical protein